MSAIDPSLRLAFSRLAKRLEVRLGELRKRGRTRRLDPLGGLAIEPGDAEGLLAELTNEDSDAASSDPLTTGMAAFAHARRCFDLSEFESDVLLLALAPELDARFCRLFGFLNDSVVALRPSVGLAMSVLGGGPRSLATFLPEGRLVKLGLLITEGDAPLSGRSIRLAGDLWPRLAGLRPEQASSQPDAPIPSEIAGAVRAIRAGMRPLVAVVGERSIEVIDALAAALGAVEVDAASVLDGELWRAAIRDSLWGQTPITIRASVTSDLVRRLVRETGVPIIAAIEPALVLELVCSTTRPMIEIATRDLDCDSRAEMWREHGAVRLGFDVEQLSHRFRFSPERIAAAVTLARARAVARGEPEPTHADALAACRSIGGAGASKLAHTIETMYERRDLVVPYATRIELELFETAARRGHTLFGPATRGGAIRGARGFIALFAGPPGTGKTMGAQVIARELGVDLLRIDLSQVVNKYIGETEKHLDVVFREAETSGALLFFDEADALFGKRTEVKDAHDRYANIETAFLLQRLEQHPGTAVLATNLIQNLDAAFLRRLHFVIEFPLPAIADRRTIWERHLVRAALDGDVDLGFLSRFELSGGDIRNAVIAAVLMSAEVDHLTMRHLVIATSRELRKAGRLAQPDQFGPWRDDVLAHLRGTVDRIGRLG